MSYYYHEIDTVSKVSNGWVAEITVDDNDVRTRYEVTLPDEWIDDSELTMEVCAFAGYYFSLTSDDSKSALINALGVAEKIWRWGDLALRYIVEIVAEDSLTELTDTLYRYGGTVTLLEEEEE
jgi:hypothetical protein